MILQILYFETDLSMESQPENLEFRNKLPNNPENFHP